ncbi:MAG TPA: 3-dehydro-L-gulonate 2-dehydrogenase [Candidatus Ornithospirochaeta stercorigallinarum]|nr:3-dehydro-L-gulonate 2-dehydrogenase [Candidatus Ornithospirochaeta stercorigallinarum]
MRIEYERMVEVFEKILASRGLDADDASLSARIFADNSLCGVISHGANRFPRVIDYIDKGDIDVTAKPETVFATSLFERWDCKRGLGFLNAAKAIARASEMSDESGIGIVALKDNNHWMRGGTYAQLAAERGYIGICWSNTTPNMPAWGAKDSRIGNNPLCIGIPRKSGAPFILDLAMSQYSYGKLESTRLAGKKLPYPGGFDEEGRLTDDPASIEKSKRVLPFGYWKGSGLSIALDLLATLLTSGNSVMDIGGFDNEVGLSQVLIAINPERFSIGDLDYVVSRNLEYIKDSDPVDAERRVSYPGEGLYRTKRANQESGTIEVVDEVWNRILSYL